MDKFRKTAKDVKKLSGSRRERAESLISKVEFMHTALEELQERIKTNGWTEKYKNGPNQNCIKKSAESEAYNSLMKNYISAMKTLEDMLSNVPAEEDKLEKFLNDRA